MSDSPVLLSVRNITVRYPGGFRLGDISFDVRAGEVLAILGPNGAGKSSCLNIISGLLRSQRGEVGYSGSRRNDWLGYMTEETAVWPDLRCNEQLELMAALYSLQSFDWIDRILDRLDLTDAVSMMGSALSMGNRRKISFLLSLIHKPDVLLLDEPFNALDAVARRSMASFITEFARGFSGTPRAVLISSHQLEEIEHCSNRVLIIRDGKIILEWKPGPDQSSLSDLYHDIFSSGDIQ